MYRGSTGIGTLKAPLPVPIPAIMEIFPESYPAAITHWENSKLLTFPVASFKRSCVGPTLGAQLSFAFASKPTTSAVTYCVPREMAFFLNPLRSDHGSNLHVAGKLKTATGC